MKRIQVSNDIIPVGEFKKSISKWLKNVQSSGHPLIITQNGKPTGVLLSPSEYDDLIHAKSFLQSVERGISDAETGNVYTTKELRKELKDRRERRISE
jgi:prevent-host-death family protein